MRGRPIDEKIVAMKLDNSDLMSKAVQTTSIFGKIKNALNKIPGVNLGKTTKELGNIKGAANSVNFDSMSTSLNTISNKFSTLGVIATTALVNITNKAINAGAALMHSLGSQQIVDGFREYEMKMGSIGTMLANTEWAGSTLEDVNKTVNELNEYADLTIYNFAEMTASIGRFTAAGVRLEDSAIAIKGIGNLAAISGSNTQQMNTAMYQMSQMLAAGKMNLMDWNSLVNAGMGGKKTQDGLLETARSMGIAVDMSEGFRNSLSKGWLTADVFLETMKRFGEDEAMTEAATKVRTFSQMMDTLKESIGSGWAESWEIIFGDFEEATKLWTAVSTFLGGIFDKQKESRNAMLRAIFDGEGLNGIVAGLSNAFQPIVKLFEAIGNGWRRAFPPKSIDDLEKLPKMFENFSSKLKMSSETAKILENIFAGVFSVFSAVWEIVKALAKAFAQLAPIFEIIAFGALKLIESIAGISISFNESTKSGNGLTKVIEGFGSLLGSIAKGFVKATEFIVDFAQSIGLAEGAGKVIGFITYALSGMAGLIEKAFSGGTGAIDGVSNSFANLKTKLQPVSDGINKLFESTAKGWNNFKNFIFGIDDAVVNMGKAVANNPGYILAGGGLAGMLAIAYKVWQTFSGFGDAVKGFGEVMEGIGDALGAFTLGIHANSLLKIGIALAILAASLWGISALSWEDMAKGLYAFGGGLTAMIGALAIMDKYNISGNMSAVTSMIAIAGALLLLSFAMKNISTLDFDEINRGLYALGIVLASVALAVGVMSVADNKMSASAIQLLAIGAAIHIIVSAIKRIAEIDEKALKKGLSTISTVLMQLSIFTMVLSLSEFDSSSAVGLLSIAGTLYIIVEAVKKIGAIDADQLTQGLKTISTILTQIGIFTMIMSLIKFDAKAGAGILLIAAAMNALLIPISILGMMPIETLKQGLISLAAILVSVGLASMLMKGTIGGAVAMMIMAAALHMLLIPITALAFIPWDGIIRAGGAIMALMAALAVGASILGLATPVMIAGSAALLILSLAFLAFGSATLIMAKGLLLLSTLGAGAITTIILTIGALTTGLISLMPAFVDLVTKVGLSVLEVLEVMVPKIAQVFFNLVLALLGVIKDNAPEFVNAMFELLIAMLDAIAENLPKVIASGVKIVTSFLDGIAEESPKVLDSAVNLVITFIESMADTIETEGPRMTTAIMKLLGAVLLVVVDAGIQMINALFGWIPGVKDATSKIGKTAEDYIRDNFMAGDAGDDAGEDFVDGINGNKKDAESAGKDLGNAGLDGVESIKLDSAGSDFGLGFASGINKPSVMSRVRSAALSIAKAAEEKVKNWLKIASPSKLMRKDGGWFGEGFALGITDKVKQVGEGAKSLAVTAKESLNRFLDGFELPEEDSELHFKAVVDYDKIDPNKFGKVNPMRVMPDTSYTSGLVTATKAGLRQNGNKTARETVDNSSVNNNNTYNLTVEAKGISSRSEIRKLAEQIQTELKNLSDRARISKGQDVVF